MLLPPVSGKEGTDTPSPPPDPWGPGLQSQAGHSAHPREPPACGKKKNCQCFGLFFVWLLGQEADQDSCFPVRWAWGPPGPRPVGLDEEWR